MVKKKVTRPVSATCACHRCEKARLRGWLRLVEHDIEMTMKNGGQRRYLIEKMLIYATVDRRKFPADLLSVASALASYHDLFAKALLNALIEEKAQQIETKEQGEMCERRNR